MTAGDPSVEARLANIERLLETLLGQSGGIELLRRRPSPVDPSPVDLRNLSVRVRLGDLLGRIPGGGFTDPAPEDLGNVRIRDLLGRIPGGGVSDPSPEDIGNLRIKDLLGRIPGGGVSDPSPEDIRRLGVVELEAQVNAINAELGRLNSLQQLLSQRLDEVRPK